MNAFDHLGKTVRLGKGAPKEDARTFKLRTYMPELPPTPDERSWAGAVPSWPMFMNDMIGCCTIAGLAGLELCWTSNNGRPVRVTDKQVVEAYMAVGGYDPDVGESTDNGALMLDALNHARKFGVGGRKIAAYVALDHHDREHFKAAINLFGGVYLGLALPESAQNQAAWRVSLAGTDGSSERGSWGGHAVCAVDYDDDGQDDDDGLWIVTWGGLQKLSWRWLDGYCDEAYAVLSESWADADGAPVGFDLAALKADLSAVAT